jgi:hypothetical protein
MRDYGKVYSTFWSSETTGRLSDDGKLLALYLMTCGHSTIAGVFRLPDGYVAEDLGWPSERVAQGFAELFAQGFADRCATTKWVWVRKHLEWNKPENPNQRKSAAKIALSVPDSCSWKLDFMRVSGEVLALSTDQESNPSATLTQPFLNQEQKQEQEEGGKPPVARPDESGQPTARASSAVPACPADQVVAIYHEVLPELPRCRVMTDDRKKALRRRWAWVLTSRKSDGLRRAESVADGLGWFRTFFEHSRCSDFLMGRSARSAGHEGWQCDLDFLLSDKGLKAVVEKTEAVAA